MKRKEERKKYIFNDKHLEAYIVQSDIHLFDKGIKLNDVFMNLNDISFNKRKLNENLCLNKIDYETCIAIASEINNLSHVDLTQEVKKPKKKLQSNKIPEKKLIKKNLKKEKFGHIPILIKPCKELEKYFGDLTLFKSHFGQCHKCEITNNNNEEITNYFSKTISFHFDNEKSIQCDDIIHHYLFCEEEYENEIIKVIKISNGNYKNCFIISW
jgi:hypothetical protein